MNTNPDETKLALWLDDELTGTELAEMDAWATANPEQLAAREKLRKFRGMLAQNVPAHEDPPYPDFFLSRINQGIRDLETTPAQTKQPSAAPFWKSWFMPIAACAGMVLAFTIGKQSGINPSSVTETKTEETITAPVVYAPEDGVVAEWVSAPENKASVILLKGVTAIPDSTDFSETVYVPTAKESDRTATLETNPANNSTR